MSFPEEAPVVREGGTGPEDGHEDHAASHFPPATRPPARVDGVQTLSADIGKPVLQRFFGRQGQELSLVDHTGGEQR